MCTFAEYLNSFGMFNVPTHYGAGPTLQSRRQVVAIVAAQNPTSAVTSTVTG